jgi:hypothetical protein
MKDGESHAAEAKPAPSMQTFEQVLPLLVSTYHRGRLVPFIGAGMGVPTLGLWENFVRSLERQAEHGTSPGTPDKRAQRAAVKIKNSGKVYWPTAIREALKGKGKGIPRQTQELAKIHWPLVISTNYDDLFYGECYNQVAAGQLEPQILGRCPSDCKRIVASLNSPFDRKYIWHIQGFVGGQHPHFDDPPAYDKLVKAVEIGRPNKLQELCRELVVGHSEYRAVANAAVHFRRCFGEVFRSRSFLFLGSSLTEQYFLNLFSEVLDLIGPSAVPHFAFTKKDPHNDAQFLADQMNITVCEFEDWSELPVWLSRLKGAIDSPARVRTSRWYVNIPPDVYLEILREDPPTIPPGPEHAIAVVARRGEGGRPHFQDKDLRDRFAEKFSESAFGEGHVVPSAVPGFFAVTASSMHSSQHEIGAVQDATTELLREAGAHGYETLHFKQPSVGGAVPPVYGFMETVRTFGQLHKQAEGRERIPRRLMLYVGPQVALNLTSTRIDLHELL